MAKSANSHQRVAELRATILDSELVEFLLGVVVEGHPMPVRGLDGQITAYERLSSDARASLGVRLMDKVISNVREEPAGIEGGGKPVFVLESPFPLPGSKRLDRALPDAVDEPKPPQIEPDPAPQSRVDQETVVDAEIVEPEPAVEPAPEPAPQKGPRSRRRIRS